MDSSSRLVGVVEALASVSESSVGGLLWAKFDPLDEEARARSDEAAADDDDDARMRQGISMSTCSIIIVNVG